MITKVTKNVEEKKCRWQYKQWAKKWMIVMIMTKSARDRRYVEGNDKGHNNTNNDKNNDKKRGWCGVATINRLLEIIGLFCKKAL